MLDASDWARSLQPLTEHSVGRGDALDAINFDVVLCEKMNHFVKRAPVNVQDSTGNPNARRENAASQKPRGTVSNGARTEPEKLPSHFASSK